MSARSELDRLCDESWSRFGNDLKATGHSMGRIGLSCARRHPALLLGGGALLAFGATMWLTRGKRHAQHAHDHHHDRADAPEKSDSANAHEATRKPAKDSLSKAFAMGAVTSILKSAARMWLLQHLSSAMSSETESAETQGATSDDRLHAESAV